MKRKTHALTLVSIETRIVIKPVPLAATPQLRGYVISYQPGMACPGCGHRGFVIGRQSAECGRCATALPLAPAGQR